jgi:hypothetical protein
MEKRMAEKRNTWRLLGTYRAEQCPNSWIDDHAPPKPQRLPQALAGDRTPVKPDAAKPEPYKQRPDWQLQQTEKAFHRFSA